MTLAEVKARKKDAEVAAKRSANLAYLLMQKLNFDILKAIANGTCEDYIDCAKEVTEVFNGTRF